MFLILCYAKSPSRLLIEDLSWRTVSSNSMTACKIAFSQATHVDVKCCPAQCSKVENHVQNLYLVNK